MASTQEIARSASARGRPGNVVTSSLATRRHVVVTDEVGCNVNRAGLNIALLLNFEASWAARAILRLARIRALGISGCSGRINVRFNAIESAATRRRSAPKRRRSLPSSFSARHFGLELGRQKKSCPAPSTTIASAICRSGHVGCMTFDHLRHLFGGEARVGG